MPGQASSFCSWLWHGWHHGFTIIQHGLPCDIMAVSGQRDSLCDIMGLPCTAWFTVWHHGFIIVHHGLLSNLRLQFPTFSVFLYDESIISESKQAILSYLKSMELQSLFMKGECFCNQYFKLYCFVCHQINIIQLSHWICALDMIRNKSSGVIW